MGRRLGSLKLFGEIEDIVRSGSAELFAELGLRAEVFEILRCEGGLQPTSTETSYLKYVSSLTMVRTVMAHISKAIMAELGARH